MRKRTISILLTVILTIAALAGCGRNSGNGSSGNGNSGAGGSESAGVIRIGSKDFTENEIVAELYSLALEDAGFNVTRVYDISSSLIHQSIVSDDRQTTTQAGDIVLYSGNQIVIFYGSNSWAYTRLGHADLSQKELKDLLGNGDVILTLQMGD